MISIEQARQLIWDRVAALAPVAMPLENARGRVLAEPVVADMDFPPFDRAIMDGYAVRSADAKPGAVLRVIGRAPAGWPGELAVRPGTAVQINTGAPVPPGADAVLMFEKTAELPDAAVRVNEPVAVGEAIMPRGREAAKGAVLLPAGSRLDPAQIAVAASCGQAHVRVRPQPRVAILATGDELVHWSERPGPGQIRNSNSPQLAALVEAAGGQAILLGIARDDPAQLESLVRQAFEQAHVLILTGGVSVGTADFVPGVLAALCVQTYFHKVAIKPGKPTLFGGTANGRYVLGLPGNPVSTYVCFHFFGVAVLEALSGLRYWPTPVAAVLTEPLGAVGDRQSYFPAIMSHDEAGQAFVRRTAWEGSGDPFGLARGNALIERPARSPALPAGSQVRVFPY